MKSSIVESIKSLPPLSKTIIDINRVYEDENSSVSDMAKAIEGDPMIVANLLKAASSPLYGFSKEIMNSAQAVSLFGMGMTRSIAIGNSVRKLLNVDLEPYGISSDKFAQISSLQAVFLSTWYSKVDRQKAQKLFMPVFLQETGKILIASDIIQNDETISFKSEVESSNNLAQVEKSYVDMSSAEVTALVFEHWNFDKDVINIIRYADDPASAPDELKESANILNIIKTIIPVNKPFSEQAINFGLKKAENSGYDISELEQTINVVSEFI
ncbi:MAG: HDOD domain-containing protein [Thiovulaceae bacterium]|nr:HDOD domain-containing protein [Sulfurimonadaceae bacterium]MCW9027097.1 HDOD domain-containing protein [Sulfurimonadaceae bacterium]